MRDCPYKQIQLSRPQTTPKEEFSGSTPNIFVGKFGYPNVNVGFLGNEAITEEHDNPFLWKSKAFEIPKIVGLRSSLINARFSANVKTLNERMTQTAQEASLSIKPVDYEVRLTKAPSAKLNLAQEALPYGPSVELRTTRLTGNATVPNSVEKATADTDLKASEGLGILSKKGIDEHYLTKLLSLGNLGVGLQRKIVPTRWSITAVDDTIGKQKITKIKDYAPHDYALGEGNYLGNTFFILIFPNAWSYELIESYKPKQGTLHPKMTKDHEFYAGRKDYVHETAGGYFACRIAILEYLEQQKRQASVLALRIVSDDYWIPLGVWVVREAVRNAMKNVVKVADQKELFALVEKRMAMHGVSAQRDYLPRSVLMRERKTQRRLNEF
jgi:hypothetical protein